MDIYNICPSLSRSSVEFGLRELLKNDEIRKFGAGRATYYIICRKNQSPYISLRKYQIIVFDCIRPFRQHGEIQ